MNKEQISKLPMAFAPKGYVAPALLPAWFTRSFEIGPKVLLLTILSCSIEVFGEARFSETPSPEAISLQSPEFYTLKQEYNQEKSEIQRLYSEKLAALLQKFSNEADESHKESRKKGNTKGMVQAKGAQGIFAKATEDLKNTGSFKLPDNPRKELRDVVSACRNEQNAIMEGLNAEIAELDNKYRQRFSDAYKGCFKDGDMPGEEAVKEKFRDFLTTEIKKPQQARGNVAGAGKSDGSLPEAFEEPESMVIAEKGTGEKWVDIVEWTAEMVGMDVVNIPVLNRTEDSVDTQYSAFADADSKLFYKAINPMQPAANYSFRLTRIPGFKGVDVIEWPSARNKWYLIVRTKDITADEKFPLKHGFIFQASLQKDAQKDAQKKGSRRK
ncbi:MAG: hypothetical protein JW808_12140 [Victivallales bacterium]|nr:hypothetical protein [Victivallales bacterium]